jgi:dipeptidyl aminopeptidase/acylaminoacyl peptidase
MAGRQEKPRRLGRWVAGVAVVVAMAVPATIATKSVLRAQRMAHPPKVSVTPEDTERARAAIAGLVDVAMTTKDGLTLRGWQAPGAKGTVVFVHGWMGNRVQLVREAAMVARHGYGVLLYDSRGSGMSDGDLSTWGDEERRDVTAALDYLDGRPDVDSQRIALMGFSVGGSTVTLVAAADPRVRAVVVVSTWTSLEDEVHHAFDRYGPLASVPALWTLGRSMDVDAVRPVDRIAAVHPRPLLMIAGDSDDDTPLVAAERLFAAAGEPKELWIVPGANHGQVATVAPAAYEARVVAFLDGAVAPRP